MPSVNRRRLTIVAGATTLRETTNVNISSLGARFGATRITNLDASCVRLCQG